MDSTTLVGRGPAGPDPANDARAACRRFFELLLRGAFADPLDLAAHQRMRGDFCSAPEPAIRNGPMVDSLTIASLGEFDWRDHFAESEFPVLVLAGAHDVDPVEAYEEWEPRPRTRVWSCWPIPVTSPTLSSRSSSLGQSASF